MGDYDITTSQKPQEVGSAQDQGLGLAKDKQGQGLGARNGRIPARELRRGLMEEARLVTYDTDKQMPVLVICRADVIGQRYITYWTGDRCPWQIVP